MARQEKKECLVVKVTREHEEAMDDKDLTVRLAAMVQTAHLVPQARTVYLACVVRTALQERTGHQAHLEYKVLKGHGVSGVSRVNEEEQANGDVMDTMGARVFMVMLATQEFKENPVQMVWLDPLVPLELLADLVHVVWRVVTAVLDLRATQVCAVLLAKLDRTV